MQKVYQLQLLQDLGRYNGTKWTVYGYFATRKLANLTAKSLKKDKRNINTQINDINVHT